MKTVRKIQVLITIAATMIAVVHIIWPSLKIDAITLGLIILAIIPWLAPLFKTLELPGGLKFEFQELERIKLEAKAAGLIDDKPRKIRRDYSFLETVDSNPLLALLELTGELEKSIKLLAKKRGIETEGYFVSVLIYILNEKKIISSQEMFALSNMIHILHHAVHGKEVDPRVKPWVVEVGPQILDSINKKIEKS